MAPEGFTDTHSHILFSVDDGAEDIEESLLMLEAEKREGARTVFLTPHFYEGEKNSSHLAEKFELLRERARERVPEIELFLGNEIFCMYSPVKRVQSGEARSYAGGKYVLAEFSPSNEWGRIREHLVSFLREGYVPIVAHAERYPDFFKTERIREAVGLGALIQINCDTFTSAGFFQMRFLTSLLKEGLIFCVGTDAHNLTDRAPKMREAYRKVEKSAGQKIADAVFSENAGALTNGTWDKHD